MSTAAMTWLLVHACHAAIAASLFVVVARERGIARSALLRYLATVTLFHLCSAIASASGADIRSVAVAAIWMAVAFLGPTLLDALVEARRSSGRAVRWLILILYAGSAALLFVPFARQGFHPSALYFLTVVPAMIVVLAAGLRDARGERGLFAISILLVAMLAVYAGGVSHMALMRMTTSNRTFELIGESLPLALALTIAFYRYRFAFMDRFIPRVAGGTAVALSIAAIVAFDQSVYAIAGGAIAAIVVWNATTRLVRERLFGRASLASLPAAAQSLLGQATTEEAMIGSIVALLAERLRAPVGSSDFGTLSPRSGEKALEVELRVAGTAICFGARPHQQPYLSGDVAILTAVVEQLGAAISALRAQQERAAALVREAELRELATRAELSAMRAQIQPHFLFNTLNTLAELVRSNPAAAEALVERLADVFRYALASSRTELVTLREEIDFVSSYLAVEEARFEERLRVDIEVSQECGTVRLPPMSLQPIVENAIRHRISRAPNGGSVRIRAAREGRMLHIEVRDETAPFDDDDAPRGSGVSLDNVRKRLAALLGSTARVELLGRDSTGSTVTVQVPW